MYTLSLSYIFSFHSQCHICNVCLLTWTVGRMGINATGWWFFLEIGEELLWSLASLVCFQFRVSVTLWYCNTELFVSRSLDLCIITALCVYHIHEHCHDIRTTCRYTCTCRCTHVHACMSSEWLFVGHMMLTDIVVIRPCIPFIIRTIYIHPIVDRYIIIIIITIK